MFQLNGIIKTKISNNDLEYFQKYTKYVPIFKNLWQFTSYPHTLYKEYLYNKTKQMKICES